MTPAATKAAKPDIVLLANADGKVKEVAKSSDKRAKKAPARRRTSKASAKDLSAAADELLAAADQAKAFGNHQKGCSEEPPRPKPQRKRPKRPPQPRRQPPPRRPRLNLQLPRHQQPKQRQRSQPPRRKPKPQLLRRKPRPKPWPASRSAPKAFTPKTPSGFICRKSVGSACCVPTKRSNWPAKLPIFSISRNWPLNLKATTAGNPTTKSGRPWWKCRSSASAGA